MAHLMNVLKRYLRGSCVLLTYGVLGFGAQMAFALSLESAAEKLELGDPARKALNIDASGGAENSAALEPQFRSSYEKTRWMTEISRRLESRMPDERARDEFLKITYYEAGRTGLDPYLVLAVIDVSSGFRGTAMSPSGARGFMQVMPSWRKLLGNPDTDLFNPRTNLRYGCTILRHYLDMEAGDTYRALGRYRGKSGSAYFQDRVKSAWEKWKELD